MHVTTDTITDIERITAAIAAGQSLHIKYGDSERHIIPLLYGKRKLGPKKGRNALLCFKVEPLPDGMTIQSVRLYCMDLIADVRPGPMMAPCRRIDYFRSRYFTKIYADVGNE